jgi:hypothetical protein
MLRHFLQGIKYGGPFPGRQRRRMEEKVTLLASDSWLRNKITALSLISLCETLVTPPQDFCPLVSLI